MSEPAPVSAGNQTLLKPFLIWLGAHLPIVGGWIAAMGGPSEALKRAEQHPFWALGFYLGGQALLGIGVVVKGAFTKVQPDMEEGLAQGLRLLWSAGRERISTMLSRFRRRYLQQVIYEHRDLNVRGLQEQGAYTLEVEHVFVELRISPNHPANVNRDPLAKKILSESQPIWGFICQPLRLGRPSLTAHPCTPCPTPRYTPAPPPPSNKIEPAIPGD